MSSFIAQHMVKAFFSPWHWLVGTIIYLAIGLVKTREHVLIWAPMSISFIKIID